LVLFDARKWGRKKPVPPTIKRGSDTIRTILIDVNPVPPSKLP
jgi:hypothetical protein